MNADQLTMVPAWHTVQTAYQAVDAMQSSPAPLRVMAAALLFRELCRGLALDPGQMLDAASRIARTAEDHHSVELGALRTYIRKEF